MSERFTDEELSIAKSSDLVAIASSLGYTPKKIGRYYTLQEMDSMRIYDRKNWYRWSNKTGGSQIDFLHEFAGMEVKDAVFWLLDYMGYKRDSGAISQPLMHKAESEKIKKPRPFILPPACKDNDEIIRYLNQVRGISLSTIDHFISRGLIYESADYHNVIFLGKDKYGGTRFASQRGIYDKAGKSFKCDVAGSDKRYGFNVTSEDSNRIIVFESAIDLMSYMDIFQDFDSNMIALGMVSDAPLETFLREHPHIKEVTFCLDNDIPGREATKNLMEKYSGQGYRVDDKPAPAMYKDINEWLVASKISLSPGEVAERNRNYRTVK